MMLVVKALMLAFKFSCSIFWHRFWCIWILGDALKWCLPVVSTPSENLGQLACCWTQYDKIFRMDNIQQLCFSFNQWAWIIPKKIWCLPGKTAVSLITTSVQVHLFNFLHQFWPPITSHTLQPSQPFWNFKFSETNTLSRDHFIWELVFSVMQGLKCHLVALML